MHPLETLWLVRSKIRRKEAFIQGANAVFAQDSSGWATDPNGAAAQKWTLLGAICTVFAEGEDRRTFMQILAAWICPTGVPLSVHSDNLSHGELIAQIDQLLLARLVENCALLREVASPWSKESPNCIHDNYSHEELLSMLSRAYERASKARLKAFVTQLRSKLVDENNFCDWRRHRRWYCCESAAGETVDLHDPAAVKFTLFNAVVSLHPSYIGVGGVIKH